MTRKTILAMALVLVGAGWAQAQNQNQNPETAYTWITFYRVHLRNGNCLEGGLVNRSERSVTLSQPWGEIYVRGDQIDRVEFVKMKSFKDPEQIVQKREKTPVKPATESAAAAAKPAAEPVAADKAADSNEPVPGSIPATVVASVDHAITLWKSAASAERQDLTDVLAALGADVAPYLEFLLEKRTQSTPLMPVTLAYATVSEERFITFSERMMAAPGMEVREAAISGLSKTNSPRRIPIVVKAMEDTFPSVWKIALETLLAAAKSDSDKSEMVDLITSRIHQSKNATAFAIALARIGGRQARQVLWDMVTDVDETLRLTGLHGLGIMADPEDGDRLIALLHDPSTMVRKATCLTLGKMKYPRAVADLVSLLSENDPGLNSNARWALKEITGALNPDKNEAWTEWWANFGSKSDRFQR